MTDSGRIHCGGLVAFGGKNSSRLRDPLYSGLSCDGIESSPLGLGSAPFVFWSPFELWCSPLHFEIVLNSKSGCSSCCRYNCCAATSILIWKEPSFWLVFRFCDENRALVSIFAKSIADFDG